MKRGAFLLSIDTELAWGGVHDGSFRSRMPLYRDTRQATAGLLNLLAEYDIRATWAVVGHLFLDTCKPVNGKKHENIVRPDYSWFQGDWMDSDPCTDAAQDPTWYGPDIVEGILACPTAQEIGSHGFSHTIAGDPGCSRAAFESEIVACREAARHWGVTLRSFVYPRNSIGHLDVLADHGFTAYRGVGPAWHHRLPGLGRKVARTFENLAPFPPLTSRPTKEGALWNLPASSLYLHRAGWRRKAPIALRVLRAKAGLTRAAREGSSFHLWFHPFNLATDPHGLLDGLRRIFRHASRLREQGRIRSLTMGELAEELRSTQRREVSA